MKVQRVELTLEQLRSIPEAERSLIVVLAHALNEINTLNKLLFLSTQFERDPKWIANCHVAQSLTLVRSLVGKLNEAWEVVRKGFLKTKLSKKYDGQLHQSASTAFTYLKSYFGHANLMSQVRNNFGFHYSLDHAKTDVPDSVSPDEIAMYIHESNTNSFYQFAESIMNQALVDSIAPSDPDKAFNTLLKEMFTVTNELNQFVQGLMIIILDKFIGADLLRQCAQEVDLGVVPKSNDIHIPFFLDVIKPS